MQIGINISSFENLLSVHFLLFTCFILTNLSETMIETEPNQSKFCLLAEEPLLALISWITSQLQSSASSSLSLVTPTLTALMDCPEARIMFANSGGIGYLSRHLRTGSRGARRPAGSGGSATVQQLYELCFCLWTLTYECNGSASVRSTFARDNAVPSLVDLVSSAPREKVVRVALSALRTLAQCTANEAPDMTGKKEVTGSTFLNEMIGCGLIKYVDLMKERQWTDPDIVDGTIKQYTIVQYRTT